MSQRLTYREALEKEQFDWGVPWLGLNESILGIEVKPFTPNHHLVLVTIRSPFVCGGNVDGGDVWRVLWALDPRWNPKSKWRKFVRYVEVSRAVRRYGLAAFIDAIDAYFSEVWTDAPPRGKTSKPCYSFVVPLLHTLCPKYGIVRDILAMPYRQSLQLQKLVLKEYGVPITAPSDAILAAELAEINERNQKQFARNKLLALLKRRSNVSS